MVKVQEQYSKFLPSLTCPSGNFIVQTVIWETGFDGHTYGANANSCLCIFAWSASYLNNC